MKKPTDLLKEAIAAADNPGDRKVLADALARMSAVATRGELHAVVLVDESGSMTRRKSDTIRAVNGYIAEVANTAGQETRFTVLTFHGGLGVRTIVANTAVSSAVLNADNYLPENGGSTPLFDAVARAIAIAESSPSTSAGRVAIVIQTDGEENASVEFAGKAGLARLNEMITAKKAVGWQFTFLGAELGEAAYVAAASMGLKRGETVSYASARSIETFNLAAARTSAYAATGNATVDIDEQAKKAVGDTTAS